MNGTLRRSGIGMVIVLVVGILVAACGGGEKATPTPPLKPVATPTLRPAAPTATPTPALAAKLTIAVSSFLTEELQPSFGRVGLGRSYMGPMYDPLFLANEDGSIAPGVIDRWQMAADGNSWTLNVRQGMRWHDGAAVTADDVKFTYDIAVAHTDSPRRGTNNATFKARVATVDVLSPSSVRLNLQQPWPLMPYDVGPRTGTEGMVVPKAYTDRVGEKGFEEKPLGSGPYQLVRHETGVRFLFQPSPYTHPYRAMPQFKEMEFVLVPEESTRIAMLRTGAADVAELGSFDTAKALQKEANFRVLTIPRLNTANIVLMGYGDPRLAALPLGKKDVRQALLLSVNSQEIIDTIFGGLAEKSARMLVVPGTLGWDDSWKQEPYDPARAKELITAAGYPRGFSIKMYSFASPGAAWMPRFAEAVTGFWSNIGIQPTIVPTDTGSFFQKWAQRPQPEEFIGQADPIFGGVTPTNVNFLRVFYHSKGITYNHPSPETDALVDQAAGELDLNKQAALIRQFVNIVHADYTTIPVAIVPDVIGVGPRIGSWKNTHLGGIGYLVETITPK